ncbi:MAG: chloride channel protein, partial [Oryzihumus sp.]
VTASLVLVPGLLGAGVGALIFVGLGSLTGHGTFSLAIPDIPGTSAPTPSELVWAVLVGLVAAPCCLGIRWLAVRVRTLASGRVVLLTPVAGLAVAALAVLYAWSTGNPASTVLFSGQSALPQLVDDHAAYTVEALVLLFVCKGVAYVVSLGSFRGGPTFPAMFIGAAGGIALSHLPGLAAIPGVAIGIGAFTVGMLRLPLTSVLLTSLFLGQDGITLMPLTIIAVVVSYVLTQRLTPAPRQPATAGAARART